LRIALIDHRFSHQEFTPVLTHGDVWTVIAYVLIAGAGASSLMAFIALRRHVNAAEPKKPSRSLRKSIPPPRVGLEELANKSMAGAQAANGNHRRR
jgi:hypothetical protein